MPRKKKHVPYTKEEFTKFVSESQSKAELIRKMGGDGQGGGWYRIINRMIRQWDIDTSHFIGQGWAKGKSIDQSFKRIPNEEIFVENSSYSQPRYAVIRDNLIEYKCSECGITDTWNGKPITLHLDHINGISNDNRLENLRWLCPNCHSQTPTYGYSSSHVKKKRAPKPKVPNTVCEQCGKHYHSKSPKTSKYCSYECSNKASRKVDRPDKETLKQEIDSMSWTAIGQKYNVSDNAVRKWAKSYSLVK